MTYKPLVYVEAIRLGSGLGDLRKIEATFAEYPVLSQNFDNS
jgi:hypothetical protein